MPAAISIALRSAALALALIVLPAAGSDETVPLAGEWQGVALPPPAVQSDPPPEPAADHAAAHNYARVLLVLTALVAALIFVSSVDDAFVDAYYWLSRARRRKRVASAAALNDKAQSAFAIMVPAWKEHDVIAAMIENSVKTLDYSAFRIFCGVYRNDPATAREVDRMAQRYPDLVTKVDVPHDGPTCKGDCLNHIVRRILADEHPFGHGASRLRGRDSSARPQALQRLRAAHRPRATAGVFARAGVAQSSPPARISTISPKRTARTSRCAKRWSASSRAPAWRPATAGAPSRRWSRRRRESHSIPPRSPKTTT